MRQTTLVGYNFSRFLMKNTSKIISNTEWQLTYHHDHYYINLLHFATTSTRLLTDTMPTGTRLYN